MARRHKKVIWTKQGYSTLDEALAYIAQDSLTVAKQLLESALDSAESLSLFDERGRIVGMSHFIKRTQLISTI